VLLAIIKEDWKANALSKKGRVVVPLFRISHWFVDKALRSRNPLWKLGIFVRIAYLIVVVWILGVELHDEVTAGPGLAVYHGQALVVNGQVVLGRECVLRHSVTIGNTLLANGEPSMSPVLGDYVEVGAQVVILGPIHIGNHARIGAGAVVLKDVPDGATVVGNPARIIKIRDFT
jgi:putative colanic acid biosynthesis acetyltransferase WcaB